MSRTLQPHQLLGRAVDADGALPAVEALALADLPFDAALAGSAATLRDRGFGNVITYSPKVFIPLSQLCRDVCHYCTFAQTPRNLERAYLTLDEVVEVARQGAALGCREALFTLGEKPELRYAAARTALNELGYTTTLDYLHAAALAVFEETGLLPHLNPGTMTPEEVRRLRSVSPSMGLMIESASERLTAKGMAHYGSPDKEPAVRLATLDHAGEARVPFTTGILIGIGETRRERIESLLAIRERHQRHGHVQEIIVQNFRAKPGTKMAQAAEPPLEELLWTIAVTRLVFGSPMSVQAPPNLSPGALVPLVAAGLNDWGGVSPLTPDFVNPEAPWPHLDRLREETAAAGSHLAPRLTVYPRYALEPETWLDPRFHSPILQSSDATGLPRSDAWHPGADLAPPAAELDRVRAAPTQVSPAIAAILDRAASAAVLSEDDITRLFEARGDDFSAICRAADARRREICGDDVSYVVNRNINYTNVCYFKCQFCAFSKGKLSENLRGPAYDLEPEEIARRVSEAWARGATEVCMQGGIHPQYTGRTYLDILQTVTTAEPGMHVHAFSPLEVWQGAKTLDMPLEDYLRELRAAGLDTLPGTAAEILDDEVRATLCPDKLNSRQWLEVMRTAHRVGFRTTATVMYGHIEQPRHWARHLCRIRELQAETGGFTEFVPLPFVHMEAPLYRKGRARQGPTFREAILMHAVARLALHPYITNIQASWVKMGHAGVRACLDAGVNDLGGTLMNESITRAAGAVHGQETTPESMEAMIRSAGRTPRQRATDYGPVTAERHAAARDAAPLLDLVNAPAVKYQRADRPTLVRSKVDA